MSWACNGGYVRIVILIPSADFRDETVSKSKLILEKWGVEAIISSYTSGSCSGIHGAVYTPRLHASKLNSLDYEGIMLADGTGIETLKMYDYRPLLDTVRLFSLNGRLVAAVGNAMKILARANIILNVSVARPPDDDTERLVRLFKGRVSDSAIESQGNIMTLGDSAKIEEFAKVMLDRLGVT